MDIWVVIPTYNEAGNITDLIFRIFSYLPQATILIVDDNSPDGTSEIVERMGEVDQRVQLIRREKKRGYGSALIEGLKYAAFKGANFVAHMDADFSHDPKSLLDLIFAMKEGADIAIGSRYISGGMAEGLPLVRKVLSKTANWLIRKTLRLPIKDCTSGFRVYRKEALQALPFDNLKVEGPCFLFLMTAFAFWKGLKTVEVPIFFSKRRRGKSKLRVKAIVEAFISLLKVYLWKKTGRWFGSPLLD